MRRRPGRFHLLRRQRALKWAGQIPGEGCNFKFVAVRVAASCFVGVHRPQPSERKLTRCRTRSIPERGFVRQRTFSIASPRFRRATGRLTMGSTGAAAAACPTGRSRRRWHSGASCCATPSTGPRAKGGPRPRRWNWCCAPAMGRPPAMFGKSNSPMQPTGRWRRRCGSDSLERQWAALTCLFWSAPWQPQRNRPC